MKKKRIWIRVFKNRTWFIFNQIQVFATRSEFSKNPGPNSKKTAPDSSFKNFDPDPSLNIPDPDPQLGVRWWYTESPIISTNQSLKPKLWPKVSQLAIIGLVGLQI